MRNLVLSPRVEGSRVAVGRSPEPTKRQRSVNHRDTHLDRNRLGGSAFRRMGRFYLGPDGIRFTGSVPYFLRKRCDSRTTNQEVRPLSVFEPDRELCRFLPTAEIPR